MHRFKFIILLAFMVSCAGLDRGCSSLCAQSFGSDWIVVELTEMGGVPYRCWELRGVSITNETSSDGVYWKNNKGNLVHVAGSYDYVQVVNGQWKNAFAEINMTKEACARINARRFNPSTNQYEDSEAK